ncbi:MAG: hypothetical protein BWY27_00194 [Bacteroidetes bacterium ADurb.Bin234]|nr:MAG: hypothetical protein BWY27_00194 [Bacteroidetes bacterium ADurb.Bin234]
MFLKPYCIYNQNKESLGFLSKNSEYKIIILL